MRCGLKHASQQSHLLTYDGRYRERKCADTTGTVLVACRFQCQNINIFFSNKIYGGNFIKQHLETVMVWNYRNADFSLKNKSIALWIIIFGTLSFPNSSTREPFLLYFPFCDEAAPLTTNSIWKLGWYRSQNLFFACHQEMPNRTVIWGTQMWRKL